MPIDLTPITEGMLNIANGLRLFGAGLAIGIGALGTGLGVGLIGLGALQGIARNPEARGPIMTNMILAIAFTEAIAIYALIVAILLAMIVSV